MCVSKTADLSPSFLDNLVATLDRQHRESVKILGQQWLVSKFQIPTHTGRNCFNLFQISFSANTADAHPGVSGVSKDQKFCQKFKNTHCQVDCPAKME